MNKECKLILLENYRLTFEEEINTAGLPASPYVRLDIVNIMKKIEETPCAQKLKINYKTALYTDTDTLLMDNFNLQELQKKLRENNVMLIGPEMYKKEKANSGVLFINVTSLSSHFDHMINFAVNRSWQFSAFDQGLILEYFGPISGVLPDSYNWKPYWGLNKDAAIVHFHGPKPGQLAFEFMNILTETCKSKNNPEWGSINKIYGVYISVIEQTAAAYKLSHCDVGKSYESLLRMYLKHDYQINDYGLDRVGCTSEICRILDNY